MDKKAKWRAENGKLAATERAEVSEGPEDRIEMQETQEVKR